LAWPLAGEHDAPVGQLLDQAVGQQAVQRPVTLQRIGPNRDQVHGPYRCRCAAQHVEQPTPHLPIGARESLGLAARTVVGRGPGQLPGTIRAYRAGGASRRTSRTDQRPQLHHRHREQRRSRRLRWEQRFHARSVHGGDGRSGPGATVYGAGEHPGDVGVDHGRADTEGERRDRPGGVGPDPGQRLQILDRCGHRSVELTDDLLGRRM